MFIVVPFYLDPGSGSMIIQLLIASVAAILVLVGASWGKIKSFLGGKKADEGSEEDEDEV
jgi:hypothetical protein